ncbi:MAG: hypothetical protein K2Q03_01135 [Sphingobacteriaceae bacterium]|nr:hypothetical protein [Sphingobacteriaceae bacterium]
MKNTLSIFALSILITLSACKKNETPSLNTNVQNQTTPITTTPVTPTIIETEGKANITFDARFGADDFAINKDFVLNSKTFNFKKFRYWVSNLVLINEKGEEYKVPNAYYLIEENDVIDLTGVITDVPTTIYPANKREDITLNNIPVGNYKSIKFSIGVEKKYNDNLTLQAGELNQVNGMVNVSWMWLTSYIFTSTTGKVTEGGTTKDIAIETGLNDNYKTISLDFAAPVRISSLKNTSIILNADVAKSIEGLDIISNPSVGGSTAALMTIVANNYATKVFSVKSAQ